MGPEDSIENIQGTVTSVHTFLNKEKERNNSIICIVFREKEIRQKETEKIQQNNFDIDLERRRREKAEYEKQQKQDEVTRLSREVEHLKGTFHMGKAGSSSSSLRTGHCLAPNKHNHQIQPSYTTPLKNTELQNLTANSSANNPQQVTTVNLF